MDPNFIYVLYFIGIIMAFSIIRGIFIVIYEDCLTYNMRILLRIQWFEIKKEMYLWIFVFFVCGLYITINIQNEIQFMRDAYDGITFSIIAAFIFYLFCDFFPRTIKRQKEILQLLIIMMRIMEFYKEICRNFPPVENPEESDIDDIINDKDEESRKYKWAYISGTLHTLTEVYLHMWEVLGNKYLQYFSLPLQYRFDLMLFGYKDIIRLILNSDIKMDKERYFHVLNGIKQMSDFQKELYLELGNKYLD